MALILKRITNPYECVRCCITKKLISYGEEYYWDPIDNFVVDFGKKFVESCKQFVKNVF